MNPARSRKTMEALEVLFDEILLCVNKVLNKGKSEGSFALKFVSTAPFCQVQDLR